MTEEDEEENYETSCASDHLLPSTCHEFDWIYVKYEGSERIEAAQQPVYANGESNCGKWLIFAKTQQIDEFWVKIRAAVRMAILGFAAKVSTTRPQPANVGHIPGQHVICVYTYDWTDFEDVMRVRNELMILGFTQKLGYKTDADTLSGKYVVRGHRNICKYLF